MQKFEITHAVYDLMTTAILSCVVFGPQPAWSAAALAFFLGYRLVSQKPEPVEAKALEANRSNGELLELAGKVAVLQDETKAIKTRIELTRAFNRPAGPAN